MLMFSIYIGLAPETADFKLNRLNWMPFLRLVNDSLWGPKHAGVYLDFAMEHNQLQKSENWESASELYMKLKEMAQL